MKKTVGLLMLVGLFISSFQPYVFAENKEFYLTQTFKCDFPIGSTFVFHDDKGEIRDKPKVENAGGMGNEFIFDSINVQNGTGRFVGNQGSTDLTVIAGLEEMSLIEVTPGGTVQMTVIYNSMNGEGAYLAVHSRHTSTFGVPMPSQYAGSCRVHE